MSTSTRPTIKIGTLAERLAASANVPLEQAIAGVRAHGPQPTRPNPSIAAWEHYQSLKVKNSQHAQEASIIETEQNTMPSLIPQRVG
ncbi:MAG TPA: hypothetical protein DIT13_13365 [Verrucomicrobiales bacterium]|nr:hypothetical protein [Verrucomicrobiales bacterium]HRK15163.1 hypothetical protein [Prosthecobacter sp.]